MNQKKIKFGVIGADPDLRANFIFKNFPREKGELIAICDHDPENAGRIPQKISGICRYKNVC